MGMGVERMPHWYYLKKKKQLINLLGTGGGGCRGNQVSEENYTRLGYFIGKICTYIFLGGVNCIFIFN